MLTLGNFRKTGDLGHQQCRPHAALIGKRGYCMTERPTATQLHRYVSRSWSLVVVYPHLGISQAAVSDGENSILKSLTSYSQLVHRERIKPRLPSSSPTFCAANRTTPTQLWVLGATQPSHVRAALYNTVCFDSCPLCLWKGQIRFQ